MHPLRVRYGECDPQQIVFNANYFAYFDVAMTELWRAAIGHYGAMMERGVYLPCSQFEAAFISAAHTEQHIAQTIAAARHALAELTNPS